MYTVLIRQGNKYGREYSEKLAKSLLRINHTPLILGDGMEANIPSKYHFNGWWTKLELFSPEMEKYRPLIYLDIDSLVIRPFIIEVPTRFTVCREWMPGMKGIQTSMMLLPKDTSEIWQTIQTSVINFDHGEGDQYFLKQFTHDYIQDKYPNLISSYKVHSRQQPQSDIVTFHGKPKPADPKSGWAYELWKTI